MAITRDRGHLVSATWDNVVHLATVVEGFAVPVCGFHTHGSDVAWFGIDDACTCEKCKAAIAKDAPHAVKVVDKRVVTVAVGTVIENASGRTEKLLPSDWDRAMFRWPNPIEKWREKHAIACNIEITGRTFQYRRGDWWVKVRMEWVQDDEPSTYSEAWAKISPWDCPLAGEAA